MIAAWRDKAACLDLDPAIFFEDTEKPKNTPAGRFGIARARAICAECPVIEECRADCDRREAANTRGTPRANAAYLFGMYAGELPRERVRRRLLLSD